MTKPRGKPKFGFHAFLVEPKPGFRPTNWRQNPEHYRIIQYVGPKQFKGSADAWKFLHNHDQMNLDSIKQWAIYLDFESPVFESESAEEKSQVVTIRRANLVCV